MLKQTDAEEPNEPREGPHRDLWHLLLVILGAALWLGLLVLTYYTLLTLPLIVIVTVLLYLLITKRSQKRKNRGWQSRESDWDEKNNHTDGQ
jgi:Flp pilus assembly protein TadB